METEAGWSGGEETGLNGAPVITAQALVRSRFRKEQLEQTLTLPGWLHKRPQVTAHRFCRLRNGP